MRAPDQYDLVDDPAAGRLNLCQDGTVVGFAEYSRRGAILSVSHVEVDPQLRGQGVAAALARSVLDFVRADGSHVLPYCPFLRGYLARHPEYLDLVPPEQWPRFGFPDRAGS